MIMADCPVCGGTQTSLHARARDIEYFTSERDFDIRACAACDILFIDPMLSERLGDIYPANYYSFQGSTKNPVTAMKEWLDRRALVKLTRDIPGEELSVLDIGGGTGWLLDQVKLADPRVRETMIVDIDDSAQAAAGRKGHDFFLGRFEDVDVNGKTFNLILMLNLIEHVADPKSVLSKAAGMLKPGGVIWVKTPNFKSLDARIFRHRSWAGYHAPRHFIIFNKTSFEKLAKGSGLSIASFHYTQGAPFWSISILNALRSRGLVKASSEHPSIYHPLTPLLQGLSAGFDFLRKLFGAKLSQMVFTLKRS
jgi:2-polyprenyl-3-methyl-5-hydroxy-6-metoxy-1,4-benzoquinol methylase